MIGAMMEHLITIRDAAYESLLSSYKYFLDKLNARRHAWEEETKGEEEEEEAEEEAEEMINPYETLAQQLRCCLRQLPVIGFNSDRYDLNVVKRFFVCACVLQRRN